MQFSSIEENCWLDNTLITVFNLDTQISMDSNIIWSRLMTVTSPPPQLIILPDDITWHPLYDCQHASTTFKGVKCKSKQICAQKYQAVKCIPS